LRFFLVRLPGAILVCVSFMFGDKHVGEIIHTADALKHLHAAAANMHTLGNLVVTSCRGSFASLSLGPKAASCGSPIAALAVERSFLAVFKRCCR